MPGVLLQSGARRRRRRVPRRAVLVLALAVAATLVYAATAHSPGGQGGVSARAATPLTGVGTAPAPLAVDLRGSRDRVRPGFAREPAAGLLFDVDTGAVLWRRAPREVRPVASLTKMMTALVVVDALPADARVPVTPEALAYRGSGVGMLPRGKALPVRTMLHGLLLVSGNDAAIALAQRTAGGVRSFVRRMNRRARALGLTCTRFSSPHGLRDAGNASCAADMAALGRAVLREPRLAGIVARRSAALRYPGPGGRLYLYNGNPLLRTGYRGATGVKTGYTQAAGRSLVATAERGRTRLGVVLLDSPDPGAQARALLDRGFALATRRP